MSRKGRPSGATARALRNNLTTRGRLDEAHHVTSLTLDGALHVVELPEKLHKVLDVGTGTGIWAIDFAE